MQSMYTQKCKGFSLVELSITLVVVALLLGGVMASIQGVKHAKMRNVISEVTEIQTAIALFEEQYNYMPGDMPGATTLWPASGDGDGNWLVEYGAAEDEDNLVFAHLLLAGLYHNGTSFSTDLTPGSSIPESTLEPAGYWFAEHNTLHGFNYGNAVALAAYSGDDNELDTGFLTAEDARSLDGKIDDGAASTGYVHGVATAGTDTGCVDGGWGDTVTYQPDDTTANCRLVFFYRLRP